MAVDYGSSYRLLNELAHALELSVHVSKVVIEIDIKAVPVVYVKQFIPDDAQKAIVKKIKEHVSEVIVKHVPDVHVSDAGEVTITN